MGSKRQKVMAMALLGSLLGAACSVVGIRSGTEEPRHEVVERIGPGGVEIRRYEARQAAETDVAGDAAAARSEGFTRLAGYIFGGNQGRVRIEMTAPVAQSAASGERIAMTAPVAQAEAPGGWVIRFFLPASLVAPPRPNDERVRIVAVPEETVAVVRFSGLPSDAAVATHRAALLATVSGSRWRAVAEPVSWFYDPPWTLPPLRRNEVAVLVESATAIP